MNRPVEIGISAPLYRDVKRLLTQSIAQGEWPPGTPLPSEPKLAERFSVSIGTLRKAIDELVAERIVVRRQGRGTFVARHGESRPVFHFFHIVPSAGGRPFPETRTLNFRRSRADPGEAAKLALTAGDPVFRIRNVLSLAGQPVLVDDLVLPQRLFPDLTEKIFAGRDNTIYHLYQSRYGINVVRTSERLRAALANADVARLLDVPKSSPVLEIRRVALTYHDAPVELRRSLVNTERHEYFSDLGKDQSA